VVARKVSNDPSGTRRASGGRCHAVCFLLRSAVAPVRWSVAPPAQALVPRRIGARAASLSFGFRVRRRVPGGDPAPPIGYRRTSTAATAGRRVAALRRWPRLRSLRSLRGGRMAPSSAKPRAGPEGSGRPTARGNCYRFFCRRKICRIELVRIFGVWPDWDGKAQPNCRALVVVGLPR